MKFVSFSSSGYLDVSVPRVPHITLWIHVMLTEVFSAGFPHSEICGSMDICSSPQLIAAYHVFLRLSVPRHPPCALISLIIKAIFPCESCDLLGMSISSILNRLIFLICKYVSRHIYWMSFLSVLENIVKLIMIPLLILYFLTVCSFQGTV